MRRYELVDLTHPLNEKMLFWPTAPSSFQLERLSFGTTPGGWFYSASRFCTREHGGTRLDAPITFDSAGRSVESIPLEQLIAPAVVIDVAAAAAGDADYRRTVADVQAFERRHGRIPTGSIVIQRRLIMTGDFPVRG